MGIGDLQPHRHGARGRVQHRIDKTHHAFKRFIRVSIQFDLRLAADLHQTDVMLEHIGYHPYRGKIGDLVEHFTGHKTHPLHGLLFQYHTVHRRMESQVAAGCPGFGQTLYLLRGNIPVLQAQQAGFGELLHTLSGIAVRIFQ